MPSDAKITTSFKALLRQHLKNPLDVDISSDKEWTETVASSGFSDKIK